MSKIDYKQMRKQYRETHDLKGGRVSRWKPDRDVPGKWICASCNALGSLSTKKRATCPVCHAFMMNSDREEKKAANATKK